VGVDVSMDHITRNGYECLAHVISLFVGFFILILTLAIWFAEYRIVRPINAMDIVTSEATYATEEAREETQHHIHELEITTGDEIENLYKSVCKTTDDMVVTVENLEHQTEVIRKLQNGLILVLADMVESRDQNTGEHVRKTAAYTDIIMRQLKKEGIYTDQLTDEFVSDVVHSAPLHDIGKIQVPDLILNKPGKLSEDEFEAMKAHTTAGADMIRHAMDMVSESDSGYLREAMNLANFHHEKWDGTGYPRGLVGENIPLCARIMAAADVLDALISQRLYKEPMTIDETIDVFEKSKGMHFEPCIADAVINSRKLIAIIDHDFKVSEASTNAKELEWWQRYHQGVNS
jgi:response regulator RpfG family c-di-GMP phosphodiesterase